MMEGPGKISIIVPVYNAEDTLERCISSILGQTYHDLQILLVDDGSTDGSYGICQQFALIDKRIEVCHTENKGSVAARKTGLKLAVGDYIGFVDADDYIEPDLFIKLLEMLMKTNADFVHSGYVEERQGNKKIICNFDEAVFKMHDIQSKINFLQEFVLNGINDNNISSSIWSKLFQAGFIKKCFEPLSDKQQYGEDLLCLCRCVLESRCLVLDRIAGYHYAIKKCSLSHLKYDDYMIKEIQLWYHILKILEEYGILGAVKGDVYGYFKRRMLCVILGDARKKVPVPHYYMRNIEQIKGKKIVIWGAGRVGQDYYLQISKYQNCRIAAWIDSNWEKYHYDYAEVSAAENISFIPCDLIIIAVKEKDMGMEIRDRLAVYGISVEKIIWQKPGEYY